MTEVKLSVGYDEYEDGQRIEDAIAALAAGPEAAELTSLIIGDWGQAYENSSEAAVEALVTHKHSFPRLEKLFIGDMSFEECEISWIVQSDLAPLLPAFPRLRSLKVQGATGLRISVLKHSALEELIIISGGLGKDTLADIASADLPALTRLELYLGVDDYGFNGSLEDVLPFLNPGLFPNLTYLGLKNSEIQDAIAAAVADAPILDKLETLDLSLGTLSDEGAQALLASPRLKGLKAINLSYHYMSEEMMRRWTESGLPADISDRQETDDDEDWRFPSITE